MSLAYATYGQRNLPALILLHGFLGSKEDWNRIVGLLRSHFFIVTVDLPGHGASEGLELRGDSAFTRITRQISQILIELELDSFGMLGYSLGGRIAIHYALHNPDRVQNLILEGAHPGLSNPLEKASRLTSDLNWSRRFSNESLPAVLQDWYQQPVFKDLTETERSDLVMIRSRQDGEQLSRVLEHCSLSQQPDYSSQLALQPFPVHYLFGERDTKFRLVGQYLHAHGCVTNLHEISDAGHNIHREQPQKVAELIKFIYGV